MKRVISMKKFLLCILLIIGVFISASCGKKDNNNPVDTKKYTTVFDAVREGDLKAVQAFIKNNPGLLKESEPSNDYKRPPFTEALLFCTDAAGGKRKVLWAVVDYLIAAGSNLDARDKDEQTALVLMAAKGDMELVQVLVEKGATMDTFGKPGWTPLHKGVIDKKPAVVEYLANKGAAINSRDTNGDTPLHSAAGWNELKSAEVLIAHKAEINAIDTRGRTPLDYAIIKGNKEVAELLKKHGGKTKNTKAEVPSQPDAKPYIKK